MINIYQKGINFKLIIFYFSRNKSVFAFVACTIITVTGIQGSEVTVFSKVTMRMILTNK